VTDPEFEILFDAKEIANRVGALAADLANELDRDWTIVVLLQGAMPFAVDLMRALAGRGVHPLLDSLWLESYRDARQNPGRSRVVWIGRCAGDKSTTTSATRPPAMRGCSAMPNNSCSRTAQAGPPSAQ